MTRPPAELLPNMHTLKYSYQQTEFLPLLLGARLKSLDLSSRSRDDMILPSVLRYVGSRSPHLTHLSLPVMSFSLDLERALIEVVTSLTQLTDFSAPNTLLTPSVVSVLSILPCLQSLRGNERPYSPMGLEAGAHPPMNDNCSTFPSLCTLVLRIPFSRFVYWLSAYPMPTLTELHIGPIVVESADDHSRLLKAVMEGCPKLRCFFLLPLSHAVTDIRDAEPLHLDHLQWLVQGSSLLDLDISHTLPLELTPSDLVTLLKALSSIERLHLNSYPGNCLNGSEELSLDVNVLATIIPYASRVRDLGLCMSSKGLPLPDDTRLNGTLGQLRTLTIGRSPCQSAPEVAAFLSMVLPINCSIGDDEDLSEGWSEVVEYIPVFRRVRIEERLRASRSSSVD
ncbi:hypothetical protein ONZ45_g15522 [Pleurotus djamor]|nr:hypothetical protein ONZ45_g15522 [Pleurotus djamor]